MKTKLLLKRRNNADAVQARISRSSNVAAAAFGAWTSRKTTRPLHIAWLRRPFEFHVVTAVETGLVDNLASDQIGEKLRQFGHRHRTVNLSGSPAHKDTPRGASAFSASSEGQAAAARRETRTRHCVLR